MSAVFKDPNVEWNAEALRLSGMLALQGRSASGNRGLLEARLEPSAGLKEHITFQSNFVQLSSHRFQIEGDGQRGPWEGFRAGGIPATNVKRISSTNHTAGGLRRQRSHLFIGWMALRRSGQTRGGTRRDEGLSARRAETEFLAAASSKSA